MSILSPKRDCGLSKKAKACFEENRLRKSFQGAKRWWVLNLMFQDGCSDYWQIKKVGTSSTQATIVRAVVIGEVCFSRISTCSCEHTYHIFW